MAAVANSIKRSFAAQSSQATLSHHTTNNIYLSSRLHSVTGNSLCCAISLLAPHLFSLELEIQTRTSSQLCVVLECSTLHIVLPQVVKLHHQVVPAYPLEALGCREA